MRVRTSPLPDHPPPYPHPPPRYALLTPDREFPADVRRLLNTAFGQLALRARRLDLRVVMHDVCELIMEQIELYRDTRDSIQLSTAQPNCLADMSAAARDRALAREMRAERSLHPALHAPDGHYKFTKASTRAWGVCVRGWGARVHACVRAWGSKAHSC